jgi:CHAT domain
LPSVGELEVSEVLLAYEFSNGRTLGARLPEQVGIGDLTASVPARLADAARFRGRDIVVFMFIDTSTVIQLVRITSQSCMPLFVPEGVWPTERVNSIARLFIAGMAYANPGALHIVDRDLEPWWSFSEEVGHLISEQLLPDCEVCFLPGRNLAPLPLHLIRLPSGQFLLEQHQVTYAANFAMLLNHSIRNQNGNSSSLVVTVPKTNDRESFRLRLDKEGDRLIKSLRAEGRVVHCLDGTKATKESVMSHLALCDEVFFLCHGTHAGRLKGYGICLSDGIRLPPPLLPVNDAPDFARFVLAWDDLEEITSAPRLVISVACSSGRVVVAAGGVRLALEQTLFARGTCIIVSPLWDVDQEASLAWVEAFQSERQSSGVSVAAAHRAACLAMKERYKHPYLWSPFVLSGSLFEENNDRRNQKGD